MKFILDTLKIKNFKGLRNLTVSFDAYETTILGENGSGKTTIVDAFTWLLFEKDSKGRAQFDIKTIQDGKQLQGLEHEVEGIFRVDGRPLKLKKVYKEIWTKRRGEEQKTFTGHETERIINDLPVKKTEYENQIGQLIDEKIFKLLTDPMYFSQKISWQERRDMLFKMSGANAAHDEIFKKKPALRTLAADLQDKTIEDLKKVLAYQRRELNKKREDLPVKIDTLQGTLKEVDKTAALELCESFKAQIKNLEDELTDASKLGQAQLIEQETLFKLRTRQKEIQLELRSKMDDPVKAKKREIEEINQELRALQHRETVEQRMIESAATSLDQINVKLQSLRELYHQEADKQLEIKSVSKACPTCKRDFPEDEVQGKIKELEENFNLNQVEVLKDIREQGQTISQDLPAQTKALEELRKTLAATQEEILAKTTELTQKKSALESLVIPDISTLLKQHEEFNQNDEKIQTIEQKIRNKSSQEAQIADIKARKADIERLLLVQEKELKQEEINQETRTKIEGLLIEEKRLSKEIGQIEKKDNLADQFISTKAALLEESVNDKFQNVSFRLFKTQVNGALDETCDVLVDGVPFDNANTAGQVNAGLDIINSLCLHHNMYTPIFVDNRESINQLIPTNSQLINLKVSQDKTLCVQ